MKTNGCNGIGRCTTMSSSAILALLIAFGLLPALAGPGSWTRKQDAPTTTVGAAACAEVDGILYVAGGTESVSMDPVRTFLAYDPSTDAWTQKNDMPTARAFAAGAAVDGVFYVIGGMDPNTHDCTPVVEAYDPKTGSWTAKAPLPVPRGGMCGCTLSGLIYVVGGYHGSALAPVATMECYDPKTDQWTPKADMPVTSVEAAALVVNGAMYVFADRSTFAYDPQTDLWSQRASITDAGFHVHASAVGVADERVYLFGGLQLDGPPYCAHDYALAYDPVQDRFASAPSMPAPCVVSSSATVAGKIYIAGGDSGHPRLCPTRVRQQSLWVFDPRGAPATPPGSWTRKAPLPTALVGPACSEVDGILYLAGGKAVHGSPPVQTLYAYDPQADTWTRKNDMPTARVFAGTAAVDGIVYVCGGGNPEPTESWTAAVEAYDPKTDAWVSKAPMPMGRYAVTACTLDGSIYLIGGHRGSGSVSTVESYDPNTDQWSQRASLPETAEGPAAQAVNGTLYVFTTKSTYAYDAAADRWTRRASIPYAGFDSWITMSGLANGRVYLFGGLPQDGTGCSHASALVYDPALDRFASLRALPQPSHGAGCAVIEGRIYLAGGVKGVPRYCPDATVYDSLWLFDPQGGVRPQILGFNLEANATARFRWTGEVGRSYGLEHIGNIVAPGPWARLKLATGALDIVATNDVVEVTATIPADAPARFFRVVEANSGFLSPSQLTGEE